MKRLDLTLLLWFAILSVIFFIRDLWFNLPLSAKFISVAAILIASVMVLLNYHLKTAGKAIFAKSDEKDIALGESEQLLLVGILKGDRQFKQHLFCLGLAFIAYFLTFLSAIPKLKNINEFFIYLVGWAVLCLIFDLQIRLHLVCVLFKKSLNRAENTGRNYGSEKSLPIRLLLN